MKISKVGTESRDLALKGAKYVAKAIRSTIGPFGSNFLLEKGDKVTNDGYLISQELVGTIENEYERRGAIVALQASSKTNDQVGDATSTSWALEDAITDEAIRYLPNDKVLVAKKTPAEVEEMINLSKDNVLAKLQDMTVPVTDPETLVKSALVSVENKEVAELLGTTQWKIGPEGIIIAEEVNDTKSSIELVKGIRIDNGFSSQIVINNPEKQSLELADVAVLLTNYTLGIEEIAKLKESVVVPLINRKQVHLVIVARAFTSEALKLCMESHTAGFYIWAVNAPYTDQQEIMRDLEAVLGGRYIDTEEARLDDLYITDIGFAKSVNVRRFDSVFTGEDNDQSQERINKRVEKLQAKLEGSQSEFEKGMLRTRIAQFTSGFAILKVGSVSLVNRKRLKDKCDDAVNAVRLALKGGTVPGAGLAFKAISDTLSDTDILKRPLLVINDQIMSTAPKDWVVEDWVRDPYLVLKAALENACDVSSVLANVGGVIVEENKPKCKHHENTD